MKLAEENKIVHGLWIGKQLSSVELLTLNSFIHYGHEFHLWLYEPLENELPAGVVINNANEIIPRNEIFTRKYNDPQFNIGKGSVGSPFSDLFRYKLLYEKGGWWVDMDITCLQALNLESEYFFRAHPLLPMIGNVMKVPIRSELMLKTYEEVKNTCDENTKEWLLPNKILNKHIEELNLESFIRDDLSLTDWWEKVEVYIKTNRAIPKKWMFFHWMNEEWRIKNIDKNKLISESTIGKLAEFYGLETFKTPILKQWKRKLYYTFK